MNASLFKIQQALKVPKGQRNSFGNYNYRSCENILEAVKPLLKEHESTITLSDEMVLIGDRYYIKATALFIDSDSNEIVVTAYAREPLSKKGMDESQITGTSSSYARKHALNRILAVDDTKDADTMHNRKDVFKMTIININDPTNLVIDNSNVLDVGPEMV